MAKRVFGLSLVAALIFSLGFFALQAFSRDQKIDKKGDIKAISEKIDEILKNQQDIIARLEDIRSQQDVIRIRASQR